MASTLFVAVFNHFGYRLCPMQPVAGCMRKAATSPAEVRRGIPGWRLVTWIVLLAFTLQSFVTQTHMHWSSGAGSGAIVAGSFDGPAPQNKSPFEKDKTACPFCQAIVHAGAFFASAAPLLPLPFAWAAHSPPRLIATKFSAFPAHSWQSRAPPQH